MRYEGGSSNTTTANTWQVITQRRRFIVRIWPRISGRISPCSDKNCKNSRSTLTLADSEPNINADIHTGCRQRFCSNFTGQDCIPLARFAGESKRLDLAWHLAMPADSHTANTSHFEPTSIDLKPIAILLEAETLETIFPFESWITGLFASFHAAKECLKCFVHILHNGLQDIAVQRTSVGVCRFVGFDLTQLFVLANGALFLLVDVLSFSETSVVPPATRL